MSAYRMLVASLCVLAAVLLGVAPFASATHIRCGDTITQDTKLDSDVICPEEFPGNAITIAADDVTFDLAGHSVRGVSIYASGYRGIATDATRRGVAVVGGRVTGFAVAISLEASGSRIERVTALDTGIVGFDLTGDDNVVSRSFVRHTSEFGISLKGDRGVLDRNVVRGPLGCASVRGDASRLTRNVLADCYWAGGVSEYSTGALVARNTVTGNASGLSVHGSGAVVERNDFSHNEVSGVTINDAKAVIDRNVANGNSLDSESTPQGGIEIIEPGATVSRNRTNDNAEYGIYAVPGTVDGGGNRASGNGIADCVNVHCR